MTNCRYFFTGMLLAALLASSAMAQSIYGSLTGLVSDQSQAVVAGATVRLRDQQSGSQREATTNAEGYYSFVSVPPGGYQLTVTVSGFETFTQTGIAIGGGDKLNINVSLKVGNASTTVEVSGSVESVTPVDSGEKFDRLTAKELDNFIQVGTNAAEYLKIMPGFGISNGTSNIASYTGETIGINGNGNGGNQSPLNNAYSYNGLPSNSLDITADGAHVSDPGCNCATPVNPNSRMISEFKISISNYNAESQKGPGVISSVARGGGRYYHGSVFVTAKDPVFNANDWLSNYSGVARPENRSIFPGFTVGGPVMLPFTRFNRKREKLFFFTGLNYYFQTQDTGLLRATVPTAGQRGGNFSPEELAKLGRITASGARANPINARGLARFPRGIIPVTEIDPNMKALMNLYPMPNADPDANGGYNWVDQLKFAQNNVQWMSRVDYSVSDNTKLYVRYNLQRETQLFPIALWSNTKIQQLPYPTPIEGKNRSDSVTASLTQAFSPSMANEFVFGYTFIGFPNVFQDSKKVDRTAIGFNVKGLFKNGVSQFPNLQSATEMAALRNYGGFEASTTRGLYADKYLPSVSDTISRIWSTHTFKVGFFYQSIRNTQPMSSNTQGQLAFSQSQSNSIGNVYGDMLIGNANSYNEVSFNRIADIGYDTVEGFIQDSWKVTRRLSAELGIRISHFAPWTDNLGYGYSVFDFSKYSPSCAPTDYCGFLWHKRDPSVPVAGFPTRAAYYQPRFGLAYSLGGNTVLRGGWGRYYYHSAQFTTGLNVSAGMQNVTLTNNQGLGGNTPLLVKDLDRINFANQGLSTGAVDRNDDKSPYTDSYSFTLSRRVPWSGLVEVAYVGNQTYDTAISSGFESDLNLVPVGSMLSANNGGRDPSSLTANDFRPLKGFGSVPVATHGAYSNYNSLQVKYIRTRGGTIINANYTYGKALGIGSTTIDSFNIHNNYGVQSTNRTHIFNVAYSHTIRRVVRNKVLGGFTNSWQISGITQIQSGQNLTGQRGQNFGMTLNSFKIPGTTHNVSATSLYGTPNITLIPILTCDPTANLGPNQFLNSACFSFPRYVGEMGSTTLPAFYGPAYFNADLGIFKNFRIKENRSLQFRAQAFNFLNHPLWSFDGSNLALGFNGTTGALNTPLFGAVTIKRGRRVVQLAATFSF